MRTGLTKREKTTAIYFDEYGSIIEVQTHNTDLKKRLTAFSWCSVRVAFQPLHQLIFHHQFAPADP